MYLVPCGRFFRSEERSSVMALRICRCIASSMATSLTPGRSEFSSGRLNQLLPFSGNAPRFSPVILLHSMYFQCEVWTAISQMLCRPGPGLHVDCFGDRPRIAPRRFGPCQVCFSQASSMSFSKNFVVDMIFPRLLSDDHESINLTRSNPLVN